MARGFGLGLRINKIKRIDSFRPMVSCNFIALKRAIKYFVVSLVDPFFVDCIVLDKDTTHYSTSKFHDIRSMLLAVLRLPPLLRRIFLSWWLL